MEHLDAIENGTVVFSIEHKDHSEVVLREFGSRGRIGVIDLETGEHFWTAIGNLTPVRFFWMDRD